MCLFHYCGWQNREVACPIGLGIYKAGIGRKKGNVLSQWKRLFAGAMVASVCGLGFANIGCVERVSVNYDEPGYYDGPYVYESYVDGPYYYYDGGRWHHWDRADWERYHSDRHWVTEHRFAVREGGNYHELREPRYHVGHGEHHGIREEERERHERY